MKEVKKPWYTHDRKVLDDDNNEEWERNKEIRKREDEIWQEKLDKQNHDEAQDSESVYSDSGEADDSTAWAECVECGKNRIVILRNLEDIHRRHGNSFKCEYLVGCSCSTADDRDGKRKTSEARNAKPVSNGVNQDGPGDGREVERDAHLAQFLDGIEAGHIVKRDIVF